MAETGNKLNRIQLRLVIPCPYCETKTHPEGYNLTLVAGLWYIMSKLLGTMMRTSTNLEAEAHKLRTREISSRIVGSLLLGAAVLFDVSTGGEVARNGTNSIHAVLMEVDIFGTAAGVGALSYASSLGRRADVVDAEVLRSDQVAEVQSIPKPIQQ